MRPNAKALEMPPHPTVRAPMFYPTEPYRKGIANRPAPDSCAGGGNIAGEALTGGNAGQPLSSEITLSMCRPCTYVGKATP